MKKISTLVLFLLTAIMAGAQVDQTFQFIDENGNVVPDGTVITINTLTPDDFGGPSMMAIPLSVKNVSGQRAAVSMYEDIDQKPHGDWTTCAFGNCMALHETGYSAKSIVAGDYQHAITTEWIPEEGKDAVWDAKLQIRVFNIKSESSFGQSIEVPGDEVIGYGPTVTVRFVYGEQAAGEKHWWGYTSLGDQLSSLGVRNPDTYNCAIFIPGNNDVASGKSITAVRFLMPSSNASNMKAWLASSLPTTINEQTTVKLVNADADGKSGLIELAFDSPFQIPAEGIYVGYSFTIDEVVTNNDAYPIACAALPDQPNTLLIMTKNAQKQWADMNGQGFGRLFLQVELEGDFADNMATPSGIDIAYAALNASYTSAISLTNKGKTPISSIDYTITSNGVTSSEQHVAVAKPIEFAYTGEVEIELTGDAACGEQQKTLTITKVNGLPNNTVEKSVDFTMITLARIAQRNLAVEEYTGTGCGWCPRGLIGMEKMRKELGDKFVGIAIHQYNSTDPMYIIDYATIKFGGAPSCKLNRKATIDPYNGTSGDILIDCARELAIPPYIDVNVSGEWNEDFTKVNATATVEPLYNKNDFKVEFVLIADSLQSTESSWNQGNYYYQYDADALPEDLSMFGNGGEYGKSAIVGWAFNDVAISSSYSMRINKAEPLTNLTIGEKVSTSFTLGLPTKAALKDAIKKDNVYVAVLIIDSDGTVANCAKAHVTGYDPSSDGITAPKSGLAVGSEASFSLDGRRLSAPQRGLNIVRMADGTTRKVIRK